MKKYRISMQYHCVRVYELFYTFLIVSHVFTTIFLTYRACQHNIRMVYLSDHGYDAEGEIMEKIPAGGCSYIYLVGDISFGRLLEEEQLVVIPFVMQTLHTVGLGECAFGPLHTEVLLILPAMRFS